MLLERNQLVIGIVFLLLVAVGTVYAVGATGGAFRPGITLSASFADAAGLEPDDFVFVSGVRAGRVSSVELAGDHVEVEFTLESETVPNDSTAAIFLSSTLGKRAISLTPGTSTDWFEAGDHIEIERTSTPVDIPELGDETVDLLAEGNVQALQDVTTAVADILEGKRREVADLIDGVERLTQVLADRREELGTVIRRTEVLVDAAADKDRELVSIIDDFGSTLNVLVRRREEVSRLLRETATASTVAADLVGDRRAQIDRILFELHEDLDIIDRHQVDLAHVFPYLAVGLEGFASVGYGDGEAKTDNESWGNVFTTDLGAVGQTALLACGGTLDELLTELVGPDPKCQDGAQSFSGASTDAGTRAATPPAYEGFEAFLGRDLLAGLQSEVTR